jgi:hypothetical protein
LLLIYEGQAHAQYMFDDRLPETAVAFGEIAEFFDKHLARWPTRAASGHFKDPEAFDLFKLLESRPAIKIMQDNKAIEIAIDLLVNPIEGL